MAVSDATVSAQVTAATAASQNAITQANAFLNALGASIEGVTPLADPPYVDAPMGVFTPGPVVIDADAPVRPDIETPLDSINSGVLTAPTLVLPTVSFPAIPEFMSVEPVVTFPAVPSVIDPNLPAEPSINAIVAPVKPDFVYPAAPVIDLNINVPTMPVLVMPDFSGVLPTDDLVPPVNDGIDWSEDEYFSQLLEDIYSKLDTDVVNGGTGLGAAVEQALWDRDIERETTAFNDSIDNTISTWSERRMPLPDGVIDAQLEKLRLDFADKRTELSRKIMIEQAELALKNTQWAVEKGIDLENILIAHHDRVAERALKAAMATIEFGISIFQAQLSAFNGRVAYYTAQAQVYEARVRAELAKVEAFRAQIEAMKAEVSLRMALVEIYKAQIDAIVSQVNAYKIEVEAVNLIAQNEKLKIDLFKAQIDAFSAQISAKAAEYELYKAQISGEMAKVQTYEASARAYTARVEGAKAQVDALSTQVRTEGDMQRLRIESFTAEISKYKSDVDAALGKVQALTALYGSDIQKYGAIVSKGEAVARVDLMGAQIMNESMRTNLTMSLEAAKTNLAAFIQIATSKNTALQSGGQIYATLAGAAMQAINTVIQYGAQENRNFSGTGITPGT